MGFFVWTLFPKEPSSELAKEFLIEKGDGLWEIASNLEKEGLIKNRFSFMVYLVLKGKAGEIKAGSYSLSPSLSVFQIAKKLIGGQTTKEKITIIEGWTKKEIAHYLEEKGICSQEEFFKAIEFEKWKEDYDFFKEDIAPKDVEGYLFPDTYFLERYTFSTIVENVVLTRAEKIVGKMLDNFDKKLNPELREEIKKQEKSIFEIITMASLLEKEVLTFEDKKLVSGILWKRLVNDIPLQVDASLGFITGKKSIQFSEEDKKIDSPYNTYKYKGLPLGPICNPGLESIKAAVYPEESEYWYYLSTPEGKTIFSKTFKEHNLAKAKYLK